MKPILAVLMCVFAGNAAAQLTPDQKVTDFEHLAALYAKQYGPYEWKKELQGFDLLDIGPWLEKVKASKDDLEFYDVMSEYVSSLNDAHDFYSVPSNFVARLHFSADIYDGKVLIDFINRQRLPVSEFPFEIGDEVVSVDGKSAETLVRELSRYQIAANPRSTRRFAASIISVRPQQLIARAAELGATATVVTRDEFGNFSTHVIPWAKTGLALTQVGPTPSPRSIASQPDRTAKSADYLTLLGDLHRVELPARQTVLNYGGLNPIFSPPAGYVPRLPRTVNDFFTSGTFMSEGRRIGLIRIPSYAPANTFAAIEQFRQEIVFFQQNTDGLIVDQMRNPGGSVFYVNALLQMLFANPFQTIGFELRATSNWVIAISSALENARAQNAEPHQIALIQKLLDDITTANSENRGRTGPLPLDDFTLERNPATDAAGRLTVYTKPVMVLIDELSASGADMFPATIQDNRRGLLFGMRTMGAGGNVVSANAGNYSEGITFLTQSLMVRKDPVSVNGYPATAYIENVGVHPDITQDYMTRDNLMQGGRPFTNAIVAAMVEHIRRNQ